MANEFNTILTAVRNQVATLGLTFNSSTVPVAVRKLPRAEETIDTLPLVCVCPRGAEQAEPFASEGYVLVKYDVEVVLIAAGNADYTDTNLSTWLSWREQIRRLFQWELSGISTVMKVDVNPDAPLDRGRLNQNYEFSGLGFRFWSIENRSNFGLGAD